MSQACSFMLPLPHPCNGTHFLLLTYLVVILSSEVQGNYSKYASYGAYTTSESELVQKSRKIFHSKDPLLFLQHVHPLLPVRVSSSTSALCCCLGQRVAQGSSCMEVLTSMAV